MTGISSSRTDAGAGFTLIELLVVMAIIGLFGAVAATAWRRAPAVSPTIGAVMKVRTRLLQARKEALTSGRPVAVPAVSLAPEAQWRGGKDLVFYPDGSASGDILLLSGRPRLEIDWLTGFIHEPS